MSIFDFFKKPSKKEPENTNGRRASKPSSDESFLSPEMQKKRHEAAMDFLKYFQGRTPLVEGKPHAGTALAVAARLAGTSLYRSLNYKNDFTPGVVVLSEEVNQAWPQLMNLFVFYCKQNGLDVTGQPLVTKFSEDDKPRMSVEEVQREYQDAYYEIMKNHGLDELNAARAGMVVASVVFEHHCKVVKDIDPRVATGIVAMGIVEGAKTAPPPLGSGKTSVGSSENKVRNNDRLLLGEREVVIQESHDHGGSYIDLHPEVLRTLQAANVDPYLIYEKGVINQMEAKVPRIDFVQVDVEKAFEEWKSKPNAGAPIPVRLIFWLKNSANTYGYEQSGNSWIRK